MRSKKLAIELVAARVEEGQNGPRAIAMPTRTPVNEPGPTVTAMRSRSAKARPASAMASLSIGDSLSAWPRPMVSLSRMSGVPSLRLMPTEQAASAASMARRRMAAGLAGRGRQVEASGADRADDIAATSGL